MSNATSNALKLVNPEFDFEFMGEQFRIRKANLDKAIQYQTKVKELNDAKDPSAHLGIVAFCVYIMLKEKKPDLTEAIVRENIPGDVDPLDVLTKLGFISPDRMEKTRAIEEALTKKIAS